MRVQLIASTQFHGVDGFTPDESLPPGDAQHVIEASARACYMAFNKPNPATRANKDYIANILKQRHLSVVEHASATFYITGVSRNLTHELIRHRHMSYCMAGDTKVYLDRPNKYKPGEVRTKKMQPSQTRTLEQLWEMWQDRRRTYVKTMTIRSVNKQGHVVHGHVKEVTASGIKPIYEVTTANGYSVKSTLDHRYMIDAGTDSFMRLGDLSIGDEVLVNGIRVDLDDDWIRERAEAGLTTPQIAAAAGCSKELIRKRRSILGISAPSGGNHSGWEPWNKGLVGEYKTGPFSDEARANMSAAAQRARPRNFSNWANGHAVSNKKFAHLKVEPCRLCGDADAFIELDHIDGNPMNNDASNIQPLCVPCHHAKTHGTPAMRTYKSKIVSIEYVGEEQTYDIEMADENKNFVANGMVVHNSEVSQRYVDARKLSIVRPPGFGNGDWLWLQKARDHALDSYQSYVSRGKASGVVGKNAREAARAFLPSSTETQIVVTANYRAWMEILQKRDDPAADAEIRLLAQELGRQLAVLAPHVFGPSARRLWSWDTSQEAPRNDS